MNLKTALKWVILTKVKITKIESRRNKNLKESTNKSNE